MCLCISRFVGAIKSCEQSVKALPEFYLFFCVEQCNFNMGASGNQIKHRNRHLPLRCSKQSNHSRHFKPPLRFTELVFNSILPILLNNS